MNLQEIREYCPDKPGVTEGFPLNDTTLLDLSEEQRGISLKCHPELALELPERHTEVTPAYPFNKDIT